MSRQTQKGKKAMPEEKRADWLCRQIMEHGNYMRMLLIFVFICYVLVVILLGKPTDISYYFWLGLVWFLIGWMKYTAMTEVWSSTRTQKNITHGLLPFPIDRKELVFSHRKGIFWTELLLMILTYIILICHRQSVLPQKWDLLFLLYLFILPIGITNLRDGIRRNKGMK